ncbi:hypothetical protein GW17_00042978, partial [Ensete ventricosum]
LAKFGSTEEGKRLVLGTHRQSPRSKRRKEEVRHPEPTIDDLRCTNSNTVEGEKDRSPKEKEEKPTENCDLLLRQKKQRVLCAGGVGEFHGGAATTEIDEEVNMGPGTRTGGQVNWPGYHVITDANTAKAFTVASLIQGGSWLKKTGVAFVKEL